MSDIAEKPKKNKSKQLPDVLTSKVIMRDKGGVGVLVDNFGVYIAGADFAVGDDVSVGISGKIGTAGFKVLDVRKI